MFLLLIALILQQVELTFQTGNEIYVYGDMDDDGFYMGELNGVRGLVPSNFLTEAPGQNQGQPPQGSRRPGGQSQGPGARGPPPPPREPPPAGHRRGKGKHAIRYHSYSSNPPYNTNYQGMNSSSSQDDIGINCMFCMEKKVCCSNIFYYYSKSDYYINSEKIYFKDTNFICCIYLYLASQHIHVLISKLSEIFHFTKRIDFAVMLINYQINNCF